MYNPNTNSIDNGNFAALDGTYHCSDLILFPVPWEATVSYRTGTQNAPELIRQSSLQLDIFDKNYQSIDLNTRVYWDNFYSEKIKRLSSETRQIVQSKLEAQLNGQTDTNSSFTAQVLQNCESLNELICTNSYYALNQGKAVGLIGGDHSTPLGLIQALGEHYSEFGILHFDAHHDLRPYFQGFKYSHGSIFHNVLSTVSSVKSLTQVGIRDYCKKEYNLAKLHPKVTTYYDSDISELMYSGSCNWGNIVDKIINGLPDNVYISLDMDGLTIENNQSTGTPVPGGLSFAQIRYLIHRLSKSRKIIGFDLVECGPSEIDSIVAMRLIFQLCNSVLFTR